MKSFAAIEAEKDPTALKERLAGKSTLNRLELSTGTPDRYKKIAFWKASIDELLVDVFLEAHRNWCPREIVQDVDTTDRPILPWLL